MMIRVLLALSLLLAFAGVRAEANAADAHKLVGDTINELLQGIAHSKAGKGIDGASKLPEEAIVETVDTVLGNVIDFNRIARRVMAKHYKKANKQQKLQFQKVFRRSLLQTYATGLLDFEDYKIRLLPMRQAGQTARSTKVDFEVITASGQVFPITQSLFYHKKKRRWMVQNVIINGVNIGQLFREQFGRLVLQNDGDINAAISQWHLSIEPRSPNSVPKTSEPAS